MPGTVIGTSLNLGYPGTFARNGDCIINARQVKSTDTVNISFGNAVVLNEDATGGTYSDAAGSMAGGVTPTMSQGVTGSTATFAGFAIREVLTMASAFSPAPTLGAYLPGQACDVIERGNVVVRVKDPAAAGFKAGGKVFLRLVVNGAGTAVGDIEPVADGGNTIQLTNCFWATGLTSTDANGEKVAEVSIITRNTP